MKSRIEDLKALRNGASQSKSQQSPASEPQYKESTPHRPLNLGLSPEADALNEKLDTRFTETLQGLNAGDAHNLANTILSEVQDSTERAEKLASIVEYFRSPDTITKMAYILAADRIAKKKPLRVPRPSFEISIPFPELPPVPDFSRFYQSQDLSQPALGDGNSEPSEKTSNTPSTGAEASANASKES